MASSATQQSEAAVGSSKLQAVHRALRRSLQGIIDTAPQVVPAQQKDFVMYCDNFCQFLHHHHHNEDDIAFPALVGPCGVAQEVARLEAEHEQIDPLVKAFQAALTTPEFDGKAIARAAAAVQAHLIPHLDFEETIFSPEILSRAGEQLLKETFDRVEASAQKMDPFTQLPFFINNLTQEEARLVVFDDAPWIMSKVLYPLVFSRVHRKVWRTFATRPGQSQPTSA